MSNEQETLGPEKKAGYSRLMLKVYESKLSKIFRWLGDRGLEAIVIKGWSVGRFYGEPSSRSPGDVDLIVDPGSFAQEIVETEFSFGVGIDLHLGPRHLDTLDFQILFERSQTVDLEGVPIRVLCPEDHLRVLCVHWLTDGGERKERLWDIYWAVKNRPEDFSWDKCLNVVSERRRRWIICTIGLAHKYLELEIDDLAFADEARDLPAWLVKAVEKRWESGVSHIPIHRTIRDPKGFLDQLRKRFPPNPIMATINMEGDFDALTRVHYQAGHIVRQAGPAIVRVWNTLKRRA